MKYTTTDAEKEYRRVLVYLDRMKESSRIQYHRVMHEVYRLVA